MLKATILGAVGVVGTSIAYLFGGWDASIITLVICMVADYIAGIIVAGVFHKSKKTDSGNLSSHAGWKGLCKKFVTLIFVIVGNRLDMQMGTTFIRDGVCISFIANEILSIIENAGLMGIPIPSAITKAIAVLNGEDSKSE